MKTQEELKKLTTSRLLNYYKAERKRMFRNGFRYDEVNGWDGTNAHSWWWTSFNKSEISNQINYILLIKKELNSRENVKND